MRYLFAGLASTALLSISLAAQATPHMQQFGGKPLGQNSIVLTQGGGGGGGSSGGGGGGGSAGTSGSTGATGTATGGVSTTPGIVRRGNGTLNQTTGAMTPAGPGTALPQGSTTLGQPATGMAQPGAPGATGSTARSLPSSATNQPATDAQIGPLTTLKLSITQRSQIQTSILEQGSNPLSAANPDLSIGATVPSNTQLSSMPSSVRSIAPGYEIYKYAIAAGGTIIVVDPSSNTIVDVLKG